MKLLIDLDEEYVKAIDKIKFLVGGRTDRKLQLEIIKAIKNGKALEQEPCKDCISREAVLNLFNKSDDYRWETTLIKKKIEKIPPVTPQESKTGHWIEHEWKEMREKGYYRCSVCNYAYQRYTKGIRKSDVPYIDGQEYILWNCDNYCPNCGCRMVEPQESEDNK